MRKRILSFVMLAVCSLICVSLGVTLSACNSGEEYVKFVEEEKKTGPQFLEGALSDIFVNDTVVLTEYIDYVYDSEYTITVTDEKGKVEDLTKSIVWYTENPGTYVITYTVKSGKSKGTANFNLNVTYPKLTWEFTLQHIPYLYGQELVFDEYFSEMNIYASLENWEVYMDSVEVDGEITDLSDRESYVFNSMSDHTFKFHVESQDGQTAEGREVISIKYIDEEYMQYLTDLGISIYGDLYVGEDNYTMIAGSYCNGNNVWLRRENGPHNLPYIAYNGDYGINSFVKVDFTGNNMPTLSFFRDNYSKSIFDGTRGIVLTGGFTNNAGAPIHDKLCQRVTLYGPYMLHEYDRGADDTTTLGSVGGDNSIYPGSLKSFNNNTRYRLIAGATGIRKSTANLLGTTISVDTLFIDFGCLIIDLDKMEVFSRFTMSTYGIQALGFDEIPLDVEDNSFFTGDIVLYGKHGATTVFDKIYPIIQDKTFDDICREELETSSFKEDAPAFILRGETIFVSDYADTSADGYIFFYRNEEGEVFNVDGETFVINQNGSYKFYYSDGKKLCASMDVAVGEFSPEMLEWIRENGLSFFGLENLDHENKSVTLKRGNVSDIFPSVSTAENSLSYVGFNGDYGAGDYVAMEFTGNNIPMVSFFNKKITSNPCDGGFGFSVNLSKYSPHTGEEITVHAPYKVFHFEGDGALKTNELSFDSRRLLDFAANYSLIDGVRYGMIMGFSSANRDKTVLNMIIVNLETKDIVLNVAQPLTYQISAFDSRGMFTNITGEFEGAITIYGFYDQALKIDKIYPIQKNTTLNEACLSLFGNINDFYVNYKSEMDENGRLTLNGGNIVEGGNYTGPNAGNLIDQAYMALCGEYGFNDYIAFDFTGKNMPEIAFFAKNFDNSIYYGDGGKQGVVVATGITLWNGEINSMSLSGNTKLGIYGPYMMYDKNVDATGGCLIDAVNSALARANLVDGKHYRVIIGFELPSENAITLNYVLYDLDNKITVEEKSITSYAVFANGDYLGENVTASALSGSIVLYGKFNTPTVIDKFWGVYEETTINAVCEELLLN